MAAAAGVLLTGGAASALAQSAHPVPCYRAAEPRVVPSDAEPAAAEFAHIARRETERFRQRREAVLAGYRRIGPDFPGMGEHWIHLGVLMSGRLDPARPTFLSYADVGGAPVLIGVAYALPLVSGEQAPQFPAGRQAWHDHIASIEDEVLLTQTGAHAHEHGDRTRLAMLHAWVWLENPDGVFAKENWSLPFVRAGIVPPASAAPHAARALSLPSHAGFYGMLLDRVPALGEEERPRIRQLIATAAAEVQHFAQERRGRALTSDELEMLSARWESLWMEASADLPAAAAQVLSAFLSR